MKALFVTHSAKTLKLKEWADKLGIQRKDSVFLHEAMKEEFTTWLDDKEISVVVLHAHGNRLITLLGGKYLTTPEVKEVMRHRGDVLFLMMVSCYSWESDTPEAMIGKKGVALTWGRLVATTSGLRFVDYCVDAMIAQPDRPILDVWEELYLGRRWITQNFLPKFQGNPDLTWNDVLSPVLTIMTIDKVLELIAEYKAHNASIEEVLEAIAEYSRGK
uniref:CHAT domain-containing protein n=1 Tax=viral metagenome TaxID=1070528 RepID=A0A6H1ZX72_9ZZZZ